MSSERKIKDQIDVSCIDGDAAELMGTKEEATGAYLSTAERDEHIGTHQGRYAVQENDEYSGFQ
jgi:hypothetical protein